ncbi:MAG: cobalt-zinc-cadmium resistance protein CzcB [bacterium]|nr:MAG: cobalt-zinc-cadmium resistance protein CzcB [bacterium]
MRKLTLLLTIVIFCILLIKYSPISFTDSQTIVQTNNSTTPITQNSNIISLDKESQLLFKLRTTPVTNKVIQNSTPIPATIKMRPQSRAVVSSATGGILKMKRILGIGDVVKKDEILAIVQQPLSVPDQITLDAYKIEQRTRRIKVEDDVDHSRKLLVVANVELNRAHKLYEAGALSLKKLQEAEQKVEFASIETAHAVRNLIDIGEKDSSFDNSLSIKSPLTGVVISIDATNGQQINTGTSLLTIVDLSTVWIEAQIFETDIAKLYKATSISYQIPAIDNKVHTISVNKNKPILATTVNPTTRTVAVYFEISNSDNSLLDGLVSDTSPSNHRRKQPKNSVCLQRR